MGYPRDDPDGLSVVLAARFPIYLSRHIWSASTLPQLACYAILRDARVPHTQTQRLSYLYLMLSVVLAARFSIYLFSGSVSIQLSIPC